MNKWVKSLTAMALASSLLMVGCSKGEDKKKEDDTTTTRGQKDKETSGTEKSTDSKEKNKVIIKLPMRKFFVKLTEIIEK